MQMLTRSAPTGGRGDDGDATAAHAAPSTLARLRASQAGVDGETRLLRLLLALVVPDLVVVVVLVLTGAFVGALVTVLASALAVGAAVVLCPTGSPAPARQPGVTTDAIVDAQRDEMALLRARAAEASAAVSLQVELAHRHRALLLHLLARIDELEAHEADPAALGELFALDHLATRMRRCAEGLLVLAGDPGTAGAASPVAASEVLRGAVAEIEDFSRVEVSVARDVLLDGAAAADLVHLVAELVENAAVFSGAHTRVQVHGQVEPSGGYVVSIVDEGDGIGPEQAAALRTLLSTAPGAPLPPPQPGQLGYQVVARLARRRGIALSFDHSPPAGTLVRVGVPVALVVGEARPSAGVGTVELPVELPVQLPVQLPASDPLPVAYVDVTATAELTPILPEDVPAPQAAELPPYLPEPASFATSPGPTSSIPPESAAAAESADLASAAEAGFTGVTHAPTADWAGLPLPIELLEPMPDPADGYVDAYVDGYDDGYAASYAGAFAAPDEDEVWDAYPDEQLDAAIDGLLDLPRVPAPVHDLGAVLDAEPASHPLDPEPTWRVPLHVVPDLAPDTAPHAEPIAEPTAEPIAEPTAAPEPLVARARAFEPPSFEPPSFEPPSFEPPSFEPPSFEPPSFEPPSFDTAAFAAGSLLVPANGGATSRPREGARTEAGLLRRTPQSHLSPQMAVDPFEHVLPDDPAAVPAPDRSRALLSAYRDGLVLGRGGITPGDVRTHLDDRQTYEGGRHGTQDGTQDDTGESA